MFIENADETSIKNAIALNPHEISFLGDEEYSYLFDKWQKQPIEFKKKGETFYFNIEKSPSSWLEMYGWFNYVRFYRHLADVLPQNANFIEIGVYMGKSACCLASMRPDINFYLIDPLIPQCDYCHRFNHSFLDPVKILDNIHKLIPKCNFLRFFSGDIHSALKDNDFDAIFIDADHSYDSVKADITNYLPKLKKGGILAGHDYDSVHFPGVIQAVDEHFGKDNIEVFHEVPGSSVSLCPVWVWKPSVPS